MSSKEVWTDEDSRDFDLSGLKGGLRAKGYKINYWLVYSGLLPGLVLVAVCFFLYGWSGFYYHCPEGSVRCENPYYDFEGKLPKEMQPYKDQQYFYEGFTVGQKEPGLVGWAWWAIFIFPSITILLNHIIYNKDWKPK